MEIMEQLINNMLTNVQAPQTVPAAKKNTSGDKDGFQKLLEQKQDAGTTASDSKPERTDAAKKPEDAPKNEEVKASSSDEVQTAPKSGKELEDQMVLAAMAMLQNPVVTVEDTVTPDATTTVAAEKIVPLTAETVLTVNTDGAAPKTEGTAQVLVDTGDAQTAPNTTAEDVPAPIKAPEAVHETQGRTVEIKVEHGGETKETGDEDTRPVQDAGVDTPVFEDVKDIPVKVAEAPKAETPKPVEHQIVPRLTEALANGETRVEIQLTPENLGKVTIEMTLKQDGGLEVQIHAENRETQNLLNKNLSGLEALLSRETGQEVRVEVPRQEESQRQDLYEQQQEHQRQKQQQEERRQRRDGDGEAFIQRLRLGLVPMDGE